MEIDPKKSLDDFLKYLEEKSSNNKINSLLGNSKQELNFGQIIYESWWDPQGEPLEKNQKQLFHYYGSDADCALLSEQKKEICLKNNINSSECSKIKNREQKICQSKHPFWEPGTTEITGNLATGLGLIFNMGDSSGMHWIMSALQEKIFNTIGFSKNEQSIFFGRDIYVEKNIIMNRQREGHPTDDTNNNVYLNEKSIISQKGKNTIITNSTENIKLLKNKNAEYRTNFNKGLEIEDYLKTNEIIFQDSFLAYCNLASSTEENLECYPSNRGHDENFIFATSTDAVLEDLYFNIY